MKLWARNLAYNGAVVSIWRDRRGAAAVEFAFLAPALLFVFMAVSELAMAIHASQQVGNAARAGGEYAAIPGNSANSSGISTAVTSAVSRPVTATVTSPYCGCPTTTGITAQTCNTTCSTAGQTTGTYVSVTAQIAYNSIFPVMWPSSPVDFSATVVVRTN